MFAAGGGQRRQGNVQSEGSGDDVAVGLVAGAFGGICNDGSFGIPVDGSAGLFLAEVFAMSVSKINIKWIIS